jgi:ankyrin repeat protein
MDEEAFYSQVDDSSEYHTVSIMCVPIYSTVHLARIAPHDSEKHTSRDHNKTTALSVVGILELINKRPTHSLTSNNNDNNNKNEFVAFTASDCIKACCMVNASDYTSTIKQMFDPDISFANSLNAAVEDALRLDVPWIRVMSKLVPIQRMLKSMRLDVVKKQDMRDPAYEPGYHYDRWGLTNRMAENCLDMNLSSFNNPGKIVRFLDSSSLASVNTRAANGDTPLMKAIICRRDDLIQELLSSGADPYFTNSHGNTALHLAAIACNINVLHLLITAVGDPFALNKAGHTARSLCESTLKMALHADGHDQIHPHAVAYLRDVGENRSVEEAGMLSIDRLQILLSEKNLKSVTFSDPQIAQQLVDLLHTHKNALLCRRMLLAAEAVWLRVLGRGFTNDFKSTDDMEMPSQDSPLPLTPINVVHRVVTGSGSWSNPAVFVSWDINELNMAGAAEAFEITTSPALQKQPVVVIKRKDASGVARAHRVQREYGLRLTGLQDGVKYRFKVTAVNSAGCGPESSWSCEMKRRSVKEGNVSAALLNHQDSPWSQKQKCMYWEGLLSLTELEARIKQRNQSTTLEQSTNHHHSQHDTSRHELFELYLARGAKLRHLVSLREKSSKEFELRLSGQTLSYWSSRKFASCDDIDIETQRRAVNSANSTNMKPMIPLNLLEVGYLGLETCKFHVSCTTDRTRTQHDLAQLQCTPVKVPRGNAGFSFMWSYDGIHPAKIRKSKSYPHLQIRISAFTLDATALSPTFKEIAKDHSFSFPIISSRVVITRGRIDFGNAVLTVLCPPEVFSLAKVNYYISIPQGAFQVGTADPRSPWFDSPEVVRCVQTNDSQVLWNRCDTCPIASRKMIWREIQLSHASVNCSAKRYGKVELMGIRPIIQTHTPPKKLHPYVDSTKVQNEIAKNSETCEMCTQHSSANTLFSKKTVEGSNNQCWHAARERCEVCGHEWTEEDAQNQPDDLLKLKEEEKNFLLNPSLSSKHFFLGGKSGCQWLRFSPHMLDLSPDNNKRDPTVWTEDMILQSVLLFFSSDASGPFLLQENEAESDNGTWTSLRTANQKKTRTIQEIPVFPDIHYTKIPVTKSQNSLTPQTNVIRQQILEMF